MLQGTAHCHYGPEREAILIRRLKLTSQKPQGLKVQTFRIRLPQKSPKVEKLGLGAMKKNRNPKPGAHWRRIFAEPRTDRVWQPARSLFWFLVGNGGMGCGDCYRDSFHHSILSTRQFFGMQFRCFSSQVTGLKKVQTFYNRLNI